MDCIFTSLRCQLPYATAFLSLSSSFCAQLPSLDDWSDQHNRWSYDFVFGNLFFRQWRPSITSVKPRLIVNGIFSHQKATLSQLRVLYCFQNNKSNCTKITVMTKLTVRMLWHFDTYRLKIDTIWKLHESYEGVAIYMSGHRYIERYVV